MVQVSKLPNAARYVHAIEEKIADRMPPQSTNNPGIHHTFLMTLHMLNVERMLTKKNADVVVVVHVSTMRLNCSAAKTGLQEVNRQHARQLPTVECHSQVI